MNFLKAALLAAFLFNQLSAFAQDPHFSMPFLSVEDNPAKAGQFNNTRLVNQYRNQWPGLSGDFVTYATSVDADLPGKWLGGVGLNYMIDRQGQGTITTQNIGLNYAQPFYFFSGLHTLTVGIKTAYINRKLDWSKLTFGSQIDSTYGFVNPVEALVTSKSNFDASVGLQYKTQFYTIGFAAHHITSPLVEDFSSLPIKFIGYATYSYALGQLIILKPLVYVYRQEGFQKLMTGFDFEYKWLRILAYYRIENAVLAGVGYENDKFRVAYTYDYTVSGLTNKATKGAHEAQLILKFKSLDKKNED